MTRKAVALLDALRERVDHRARCERLAKTLAVNVNASAPRSTVVTHRVTTPGAVMLQQRNVRQAAAYDAARLGVDSGAISRDLQQLKTLTALLKDARRRLAALDDLIEMKRQSDLPPRGEGEERGVLVAEVEILRRARRALVDQISPIPIPDSVYAADETDRAPTRRGGRSRGTR